MSSFRTALIVFLLVLYCRAAEDHVLIRYTEPLKCLKGSIVYFPASPMANVNVTVFENPELWSDPSLWIGQRWENLHEVASTESDERGRFSLKKVPNGKYEVLFQKGGFNPLSVLVRVDSSAHCKKLCVQMCVSGACFEKPRVQECK